MMPLALSSSQQHLRLHGLSLHEDGRDGCHRVAEERHKLRQPGMRIRASGGARLGIQAATKALIKAGGLRRGQIGGSYNLHKHEECGGCA